VGGNLRNVTNAEDGLRWAEWLGERVAVRGAGGRVSQASLRQQLEAAGHPVTGSTVSRWLKGSRPGSAEIAEAVGNILHDRSGALLAAGYADRTVTRHRREGDPASVETILMPRNDDEWERIKSMTLEEILALGSGPIVIIDRAAPPDA
jgi:hypothetical protein